MRDNDAKQEMIALAHQLITELEADNDDQVTSLIDQLAKVRETELFQEIGKLTRELHSAITNFELDSDLSQLAQSEIPDAKERLSYVITMTNQAANRTLAAVEEAIPQCEALHGSSSKLSEDWARFVNREMDADEFRQVSKTLQGHFAESEAQLNTVQAALTEILMAQEFQDLTGQIINRVIKMVEDVESHLVNLIKVSGCATVAKPTEDKAKGELEGPQVPTIASSSDTVSGQDEVDDLLSSLGF